MLVLSRHKNESVVIPQLGITITVVEVRGDKVRLGFTAPKNITIHRQEIQNLIDKGNNDELGKDTNNK